MKTVIATHFTASYKNRVLYATLSWDEDEQEEQNGDLTFSN